MAGLSLSHSRGLGEYAAVAGGQVASSVTGFYFDGEVGLGLPVDSRFVGTPRVGFGT